MNELMFVMESAVCALLGVRTNIRNIMQARFMLQNETYNPQSQIFDKSKNTFVYGFTIPKIICGFTPFNFIQLQSSVFPSYFLCLGRPSD